MTMASDPNRSNRIETLRNELRAKLPQFMALRVARKIESDRSDTTPDSRSIAPNFPSVTTLATGPNVAIAADGSTGEPTTPGSRLRLSMDRASAGNRWPSSAKAIETWESTGAGVDLVVGAVGTFATVEVVANDEQGTLPANWRFEAVALGPDEMPVPYRTPGNPKMEGMPIPLISSGTFRLDLPIRVALHVSDAGQKALGCLVFVAPSN